ncbi:MAG: DNA-binding transcriptional regulator Fis [Halieaceae bacterium]
MRMGETLVERTPKSAADKSAERNTKTAPSQSSCLRESVSQAVAVYLEQLDGQLGNDVYQMVLAEVEAPLLEQVMQYTRNNQTRASQMLGLNRGTLRKKLKLYGLLKDNGA